MKIMLIGSFVFAKEIVEIKSQLKNKGYEVLSTSDLEKCASSPQVKSSFEQELKHCIENDSMRDGFNQVSNADAVLVCNYDKNNIKGYLGISVLMELAIAHHLNKKIFFLHNYDKSQSYGLEITIMNPEIINGDLSKIN